MPNLFVALEQDLSLDSPDFREVLEPWFESLAETVGASLMRFYGQDPEEFFDEDEEGEIPTGSQWFVAEEGLELIQTLMTVLETEHSEAARRARSELVDMKLILEAAIEKNVRFHLSLDI